MSTRQDNVQIKVELNASQGIQELGKLENEILEVQREMKMLKRGTEEWKAAQEKLDTAKASMDQLREKMGMAGLTMRQLTKYQGELRQQMANTTYGSEKWSELKTKMDGVTQVINHQKGVLTPFQKQWQSIKEEFISMGVQGAVVGVLVAVGAAMVGVVSQSAKLSDSLSNIQKTTGLSAEEVKGLNSELSKINTRTARDELRSIAAVAGQLAIPNEQILAFVTATDKLNVALGDEIQGGAEEVTRVMGGLRNVMTDIKTGDVATDMLHIGNALNVLAAEGAATAPVVADIANRIGGVGQVMGVTSGQTLGLAATMQELNITAERGSTAVVKILQHMAATPEKFAQVAGKSGAEFRRLVDTDIYGALKLVMAGAAGGGKAATELAGTLDALGVDGAGTSEVIAKMGLNIAMLDTKTQHATQSLGETKSIVGEFNTLNDNFAAKLERVGKWWNGLFTAQSLQPMLEGLVGWLDKLTGVENKVQELGKAWEDNNQKMGVLTDTVEPLLARYKELAFAFTDSGKAMAQTGAQQQELDDVIQEIAKHLPEAATAWDEYGKAISINTIAAEAAIRQQKDMLKVKNAETITQMQAQLKKEEENLEYATKRKNQIIERATTKNGTVFFWQGDRENLKNLTLEADRARMAVNGLKGLLAQAKGEKTAEQLAAEAAARAAEAARLTAKNLAEANANMSLLKQIDDKVKLLKDKQNAVKGSIGDHPAELARLQKEIDGLEEYRQKLLGKWKDKEAAKAKKDAEKAAADRKKEHDQLLEQFYKYQEAVHKAEEKVNENRLSEEQREIEQIEQKYDELLDQGIEYANSEILTAKERAAALEEVRKLEAAKDIEIQDKKLEQLKKREAIRFRNAQAEAEAEMAMRVLMAQSNLEDADDDVKAGKPGAGQAQANARAAFEKAQVDQILSYRNLELAELDQLRIKDKLSDEEVAKRREEVELAAALKIRKIHKDTSEAIRQENLRKISEAIQGAQELGNMAFSALSKYEENAAKKEKKDYDKKLKALDNQLKTKLISEEQYNIEKGKLDEEADRINRLRQRETAEAKKASDIFNATMSGAVATVRALAEGGPALAAIVGAMAAIQVAMIIAEPIPEFQEGGFTANGFTDLKHRNLSQSAGGMLPGGPFLATVNEAGAEYFVPNRLLSDPRVQPHVAAIEAIRTTNTTGAVPAFVEGGSTGAVPRFTAATSTAAQQPMTEATGQAMVYQLAMLNQKWDEGQVITAQVVSEQMAREQYLQKQVRKDAAF